MPLSALVRAFVVATLAFIVSMASALAADSTSENWLRGSGKDLELCIRGEVLGSDGRPAADFELAGQIHSEVSDQPLKPAVDGHRFTLWIPINQPHWYSVWLKAASTRSDGVAFKTFNEYQLRQAATEGIKLTLESPTRHVKIKVTDQSQPVSGAIVKAELSFGIELRSITNPNGIARIDLLPQQVLSRLTAWTEDHRIGGFSFSRNPPRDPDANEYVIELSKCRDQKMRFVAEDDSPVPGIYFVVQIASLPNYNFIGTNEHFQTKSDSNGEAAFQWFPDWDKVHFYADIDENGWVLDGDPKTVDGVAIFKVKRAKARQHITGRVVSPGAGTGAGGFFVTLRSFQGEREHQSDIVSAFTDPDGTFAADVLPDATYCAYVLDTHWVGKITHVTPYESATDKLTPPELEVAEGQPVEVVVTSGPNKKPIPNLAIGFHREYEYSWREKGQKRTGIGGTEWWAITNESGIATTRSLPGNLRASVYEPRWRAEKSITVVADQPAKIALHREVDEKRTVKGRLVLTPSNAATLKDATIRIASTDENYEDEQLLTCSPEGSFSFDTAAASIGIFARTSDGKATASVVVKDLTSPIELTLRPTLEYQGQLLWQDDRPVVGRRVYGSACIEVDKNSNSRFSRSFEAARIEATTDEQGNFTLQGIPSEMKVYLSADASDGSEHNVYLDDIYLEPNESRPRTVSRVGRGTSASVKTPLTERYRSTLRDCLLSGYRPMLIIADDSQAVTQFVDKHYVDYETNNDVYPFMQITVFGGKHPLEPADAAFLKEHHWPGPQPDHIAAFTLDSSGNELAHQQIDVNEKGAAQVVADFIHAHAPAPHDAQEAWNAAFAEANRTNRRVWVRVSGRYCGPCFRMTRWLDDQHKLLEKDYVMLKIDEDGDKNGNEVAERVTRGKQQGIPFHAIFDAAGSMLIDSSGPLGNVGYPSGLEGKKQLRKMLLQTRQNLTDAEVDQLVKTIGE